jgi:hypothetical protein
MHVKNGSSRSDGLPGGAGDSTGPPMESNVMFLDCPAYLDGPGPARCGLPAEVEHRYTVSSTDGPLPSARIRCPRGHWFNGPVESLTCGSQPAPKAGPAGGFARGAVTRAPRTWEPDRRSRGP